MSDSKNKEWDRLLEGHTIVFIDPSKHQYVVSDIGVLDKNLELEGEFFPGGSIYMSVNGEQLPSIFISPPNVGSHRESLEKLENDNELDIMLYNNVHVRLVRTKTG